MAKIKVENPVVELDGDEIPRLLEGLAQGHGSFELVVVVLGVPDLARAFGDDNGVVVDDIDGEASIVESGGVDEGLEGRTGLAFLGTIRSRLQTGDTT